MGSAFAYVVFYLIPGGRNVQEVLLDAAVIAFVGFVLLRKGVFARTDALTARVLVIGAGDEAVELESAIEGVRHGRPEIVGFYAVPGRDTFVPAARLISNGETLSAAVRRLRVSEIIVAVRDQRGGGVPMEELLKCRLAGVPVRALEGFYELLRGRVPVESLKASWLIYGDGFRQNWWRSLREAADRRRRLARSPGGLPAGHGAGGDARVELSVGILNSPLVGIEFSPPSDDEEIADGWEGDVGRRCRPEGR